MKWTQGDYYLPRYSYTSSNQYGDRFKRIASKHIKVVRMACNTSDSYGTQQLILLSHNLNIPIRYDYDENEAFIEVVSAEELRKL